MVSFSFRLFVIHAVKLSLELKNLIQQCTNRIGIDTNKLFLKLVCDTY